MGLLERAAKGRTLAADTRQEEESNAGLPASRGLLASRSLLASIEKKKYPSLVRLLKPAA